ncbi:pilin [Xanthomonas campestris pv. campestris]|nr:pilin [Xanthomonas campestris pv. campestris]
MVVVAIISVLTAIALPAYQNFVAKAQVAAALAEIEPGRSMIETSFADAIDASLVDAEYVGFTRAMKHCANASVRLLPDGAASITCDVVGGSLVAGKQLTLNRSTSGAWTCNASQFNAKIRPNGCI